MILFLVTLCSALPWVLCDLCGSVLTSTGPDYMPTWTRGRSVLMRSFVATGFQPVLIILLSNRTGWTGSVGRSVLGSGLSTRSTQITLNLIQAGSISGRRHRSHTVSTEAGLRHLDAVIFSDLIILS